MAGGLEQLLQQIEELTAAISKLSDQVKGLEHVGALTRTTNALDIKNIHCNEKPSREKLTAAISKLSDHVKDLEHAGGLTRSTDAPDNKNSHCNEKPARESGYVNWDESHDALKNSKYMRWMDMETLYCTSAAICSSYLEQLQERSITINENTRFPEEKDPKYNVYVNISHPEVICEILNYDAKHRRDMNWEHMLKLIILAKNHLHTRTSFEEKYKLRWVDPIEQTPLKDTEPGIIKEEASATESAKNSEIIEAQQKIADTEKDQDILVITNNNDTLTNDESMPSINFDDNCDSNQYKINSKSEPPPEGDKLRWVDPIEQTPLKDTEPGIIKEEASATESAKNSEIIEAQQKIADTEKDQDILVITNNNDTLTNDESMPSINFGDNCDSNQYKINSKSEPPPEGDKLRWVDPIEQTPLKDTEPGIIKEEASATESAKNSEIIEAQQKIADTEKDQDILVITNNNDTLTNDESMPSINFGDNCDSNQYKINSKSEPPPEGDKLRWVDPIEQTPLKDTEPGIIKEEASATESAKNSEIIEAQQKIADTEKDQDILVITNNNDTLTNDESMPSINFDDNCDSNQYKINSKSEPPPEGGDNTQIILTEEKPATTVDIMSIEPTSSQKLLDNADVLTQNTGDDLIVPLNSMNDSLLKQDSSASLIALEDGIDGAKEDLSEYKITSELKHDEEEDNKSLELLELLPGMLDIITQSKFNILFTELSALNLSHQKPLNIVVELFVDNYSDIMENLMKKKVNKFLQEVKTLEITTTEHFNILIELLCEKIAQEPDLAHHFAYMCHELSDAKEFRSLLSHKCQNDFEAFVINNNQEIDEEDNQMKRRCVVIVRFIGELYNRDMVTIESIDHCLRKLFEKSKEINLECACELLITSGIKIGRKNFKELSKALKKMDALLSSEPNPDIICCRVKRMMQNTINLSKRQWRTVPLTTSLDHIEKKGDRKRLLMNILKRSEMPDRINTRIRTGAWQNQCNSIKFQETLKLKNIREPPTYFENTYENCSILEKFQADPTTHSDRIISYQETILFQDNSKDSTITISTQEDLSMEQYTTARQLIQRFVKNLNVKNLTLVIKSKFPRRNHGALMDFILDEALTSRHTTILRDAMFLLVETNTVKLDFFKTAIKEIFCTLCILFKNIPFPERIKKFACVLAPHIENHNLALADILVMSKDIIRSREGHHFLGMLMLTLKERKGEAFVTTLWVDSKLSPVQWMNTEMVPQWVADYKLAFLNPHIN